MDAPRLRDPNDPICPKNTVFTSSNGQGSPYLRKKTENGHIHAE